MTSGKASLDWLMAAQGRGIQPGLERMERLLAALGNPEKNLRCLHVAGTNGKGSVCAFAESILRAAGHRTGLYTSPHLVEFSERIQIAGVPVGEEELVAGIARLQMATEGWSEEEMPTFFELTTALAFDLFVRMKCDIVVLETGLGGRLDASNMAPKIACAITPIALDHTEWLGETLTKIAREKAGILRSGIPVVIAMQETEAEEALAAAVQEIAAPCRWITEPLSPHFKLGLKGLHQRANAALALALLQAGGFDPSEAQIREGLAMVSWPGRFQSLREGRLIVDGAHNLHAAAQLVMTWREEFGGQRCRLIFGALEDKNPEALLMELEEIAEEIFLIPVASARSADPVSLMLGGSIPRRIFSSLKEVLDESFLPSGESLSAQSIPVLLAGSLFLVGEALSLESGAVAVTRVQ